MALGSAFANLLLSPNVPLITGLTALGLLVLLQYLFSFVAMRSTRVRSWMRSDPTILVRHGQIDVRAAYRERVTGEEIVSAVRAAGGRRIRDAQFVLPEPDGSLSALIRETASRHVR